MQIRIRTIECRSLGHGSAGTPRVAVSVAEVDDSFVRFTMNYSLIREMEHIRCPLSDRLCLLL